MTQAEPIRVLPWDFTTETKQEKPFLSLWIISSKAMATELMTPVYLPPGGEKTVNTEAEAEMKKQSIDAFKSLIYIIGSLGRLN